MTTGRIKNSNKLHKCNPTRGHGAIQSVNHLGILILILILARSKPTKVHRIHVATEGATPERGQRLKSKTLTTMRTMLWHAAQSPKNVWTQTGQKSSPYPTHHAKDLESTRSQLKVKESGVLSCARGTNQSPTKVQPKSMQHVFFARLTAKTHNVVKKSMDPNSRPGAQGGHPVSS